MDIFEAAMGPRATRDILADEELMEGVLAAENDRKVEWEKLSIDGGGLKWQGGLEQGG